MSNKSRPKSKIESPHGIQGQEEQSSPLTSTGWVSAIALAVAVCVLLWLQLTGSNSDGTHTQRLAVPTARKIPAAPTAEKIEATVKNPNILEVPLASLKLGEARHFEYTTEQGRARFFIVRTSEAQARTALDECETCDERMGYAQSGAHMICLDCGKSVPVDLIGELSGGCSPVHLHSTVHDGQVMIAVKSLVPAVTSDQADEG